MNKNQTIVGAIAILIIGILIASSIGLIQIAPQFTINTTTVSYNYDNNHVYGIASPELTDETNLVTAWKTGSHSVKLVMQGNIKDNLGSVDRGIGQYFYQIFIVDADHSTPYPIMWYNDYNRDYIHITSPSTGFFGLADFAGVNYRPWGGNLYVPDAFNNNQQTKIASQVRLEYRSTGAIARTLTGSAYGLEIKNPHVGKLIVQFWAICADDFSNYNGYPRLLLQDEVSLLDGSGSLSVTNAQNVYEEGQTISFTVNTGFSGLRQGGDVATEGWELKVYDATGVQRQDWTIGDNLHGIAKTYTIPAGAYNPAGSNTWKAELWNTLFKQNEVFFFTIGQGMTKQLPGVPKLTFDKTYYNMGDTATVTMTSVPNPLGKNIIYEFFVRAYYQDEPTNYLYGPTYVRALGTSATVTFSLPKGDRNLVVEANAFDAPHASGGLPSENGKSTIFVKDKNPIPDTYSFTVNVLSGFNGVPDAIVDIGVARQMTDNKGQATFTGVAKGDYLVQVRKDGYDNTQQTFTLAKDDSLTMQISKTSSILRIIAAIITFVIFLVAAIFVKIPGKYSKYSMIFKVVIGAIGAVAAYLVYILL